MLGDGPVNIALDNQGTVTKGMQIIRHWRQKTETALRGDKGQLLLGGTVSPLHREAPWKKSWKSLKDGDLWHHFSQAVQAKSPWAIELTKVKGHSTEEMIREGKVRQVDHDGNEEADEIAKQACKQQEPEGYTLANICAQAEEVCRSHATNPQVHRRHEDCGGRGESQKS